MENLTQRLVNKSIESFILGLEIYNKPTIRYRVEGVSFFITNAWELMLKAYRIERDGEQDIYFNDKPNRTIDLSKAIRKVFTNNKDPLRKNLEKIIELRNISTHFITEDYEIIYVPLFQANVINFSKMLYKFHHVDITDHIAQNFLTLSVGLDSLSEEQIKTKYSAHMAEQLIKSRNDLAVLQSNHSPRLSIPMIQQLRITKKSAEADFTVALDNNSATKIATATVLKDPSQTYKYSYNNIVAAVNDQLAAQRIKFSFVKANGERRTKFTTSDLQVFIKFYDIKHNPRYAYEHHWANHSEYSYSQQLITFLIDEIHRNPENIMKQLRQVQK